MSQKPVFSDTVTLLPAVWANSVSDLVYDVFKQAKSVAEARQVLGIGGVAVQSPNSVLFSGGSVDGVTIGAHVPAPATFLSATSNTLMPEYPNSLTTRYYVDGAIASALASLTFRDMSQQSSNRVNITGGAGTFDTLRSRGVPQAPNDVVTLAYLSANGAGMVQANTPMTLDVDNTTVTLSFPALAGRMAIFVDGIYQLPDQYTVYGTGQIRFTSPLPAGSVVGGFRV